MERNKTDAKRHKIMMKLMTMKLMMMIMIMVLRVSLFQAYGGE